MSERVAVIVHGASGRMGQAILRIAAQQSDLRIVGALVRPESALLGQPLGLTPGAADADIAYRSSLADEVRAEVVIDVAGPPAHDAALGLARQRGIAFVSGSTGLSDAQHAALRAAAQTIPVLWSANFSLGVAVLAQLAAQAAQWLADWDCEIVEAHHRRKLDAPSGTALLLGRSVADARAIALPVASTDRGGARKDGEIGYAVVRGGDIVGEHDVLFIGDGERIELAHRAGNRDIFARGALRAARWITGREPGIYTMKDVLGVG